jgi:nicotinate-nucleotide--dimethylbenzimidazole phosphoribosyltransferase
VIAVDAALAGLPAVAPVADRNRRMARLREMAQRAAGRPHNGLGALEDVAVRVAAIVDRPRPGPLPAVVTVLAADHGVARHAVSALGPHATVTMFELIRAGRAPVNRIARLAGARVVAADIGLARETGCRDYKVAYGTGDISVRDAMTREQAIEAILAGARFAAEHVPPGSLVAVGEIGVGNTTAAAALTASLTGEAVAAVTGSGSGVDQASLSCKLRIVDASVRRAGDRSGDPVGALAAVGGLEIAGNVGVIVAAAARGGCVILDGYMSAVSAIVAVSLAPAVAGYLVAAHRSAEPGHRILLARLGVRPLLNLGMRLGMASGAAMAVPLINAALAADLAPEDGDP